ERRGAAPDRTRRLAARARRGGRGSTGAAGGTGLTSNPEHASPLGPTAVHSTPRGPPMSNPVTRGMVSLLAAGAALAVIGAPASAQIGGLGRALGRVAGQANVESVLRGDPPITTGLPDARWAVDSLDNFTPREAKRSL